MGTHGQDDLSRIGEAFNQVFRASHAARLHERALARAGADVDRTGFLLLSRLGVEDSVRVSDLALEMGPGCVYHQSQGAGPGGSRAGGARRAPRRSAGGGAVADPRGSDGVGPHQARAGAPAGGHPGRLAGVGTGLAWPSCWNSWRPTSGAGERPARAAHLHPPPGAGDPGRPDAGHAAGRARPDDRGHGAADHRRRPGRARTTCRGWSRPTCWRPPSTPLYGKLGDLYGRKRVFQVAIVIFLIGSALCGAVPEHERADRLPRSSRAWAPAA